MYALDTNTVIYFFKGIGDVANRLLATRPSLVAIPSVVLYELEVGTLSSPAHKQRRKQLEQLARSSRVLPFSAEEARISARIRHELAARGQAIGPLDTLIAGTAVCHGATLVTHNTAEFSHVDGLALEDWFGP